MNKKASMLMMATVTVMLVLVFNVFNVKLAAAQNDYTIAHVNHKIEILYNGYILISDTIEIGGNAPNSFLIGFPYKYGAYLVKCVAYNSTDIFQVQLDVSLRDKIGFYGVEVLGASQNFTVAFILSNDLLKVSNSSYSLDFPAYPSLAEEAKNCTATVVLPEGVENVVVKCGGEVINGSTYSKAPLPAFAYSPANLTFSFTGDKIQLFDVNTLERRVEIGGTGEIEVSDSYYITSKSPNNIESVEVVVPYNASALRAEDQFGRKISDPTLVDVERNSYKVVFPLPLESSKSTRFSIKYSLPSQAYMNAYNVNVTSLLFQNMNCYIKQASLSIVLPEGARIQSLAGISCSVTRSVFQETAFVSVEGVTYLESVVPSKSVSLAYDYNPLWLSLRPTLWMWALTLVGFAAAVVWKRPKAAEVAVPLPAVTARLSPEHIKAFVDVYEEKQKIISDLELLEVSVRKGKIPRRRYNVQKETLKTRLNSLSRKLTELKERMRAAGGHYADLVRQLEVAETEITEVEASIKNIEARHSRGELSMEAYKRLLADYQRRKDKAETSIKGILLRLREEIH